MTGTAKTLVWVEHDNASVKDATLAVVTAASQLGEVHLIVAGAGCKAVADDAAKIAGVGKVHLADDASLGHALAENVAPRLKTLKVVEPAKRTAGIKVPDVDTLVAKLKEMGVAK